MVALETSAFIAFCLFGIGAIYVAFGSWIAQHLRLTAIVFLVVMLCLFGTAIVFNGASFTGAKLHPPPPPIPTAPPS